MKDKSTIRVRSSEGPGGRRLAVERAIARSKSAGRWQDHVESREHQVARKDDVVPPARESPED